MKTLSRKKKRKRKHVLPVISCRVLPVTNSTKPHRNSSALLAHYLLVFVTEVVRTA